MDLRIQEQTKQPSFQRTSITATLYAPAQSPSRQEVAQLVAEKLGAKRELVIISQILPSFGDGTVHVAARVYENAQALTLLEEKGLVEKNAYVEPEPVQEEPSEQEELSQEASEQTTQEEKTE